MRALLQKVPPTQNEEKQEMAVWDAEIVDRVCRHKKRANALGTESDPLNV